MTKPFTKDTLKLLPPNQVTLFACDVARLVLPLYEQQYPDDYCPRTAIETAELFLCGKTTKKQLEKSINAAWSTAVSLDTATAVINAAANAAWSAVNAAWAASNAAVAVNAAWAAAFAATSDDNVHDIIQSIFLQTTPTPIPVTPILQSIAENIVQTRNFEEYYVLLDNLEEFHNIQLERTVPLGLSHYVLYTLTNTN